MSFFEDPSTLRGDHNYNDHPDEFAFDPNATNSFNQNHMSQEDFYDENHNFEQTYNNMQEDSEPYLESYSQEQNDPNQFAFNLDSHVEAYSSPTPQKITPLNQPQQRSHQAAPPSLPLSQSRRINSIDTRESNRQPPKNRHGIELRPVSILPDQYRNMFPFPKFNAVQSSVLETVLNSDENVCVSAPTGSGKTVVFELAIIRLLMNSSTAKAVYLAPTKALTSERFQDWTRKFSNLASVVELTGDTEFVGLNSAKTARIIITTPEKWDSLTRRWKDHQKILDSLSLLLIDEVHILHEPARGPRLEVIVSRMKTYGSRIRFLALSATIPNIDDIAEWIGGDKSWSGASQTAKVFSFGDDFRPCPLKKFIYGYPNSRDEFAFSASLNSKLMNLICEHSARKPTLVFVATRKATTEAASRIAKDYAAMSNEGKALPWQKPRGLQGCFEDSKLQELAMQGVGVHHAGLSVDDRKSVENAFKEGKLGVLCSTSTLATGVNLPAYCVIIRGTKVFTGSWTEMSDLDFFQALGRAGRPQFDTDGVCVVLCDSKMKDHYLDLATGHTIIESSLHLELKEHITAEVTLSGNSSMDLIQRWVRGTYLWVRIAKNPSYYKLDGIDSSSNPEALLRSICEHAIDKLKEHKFLDSSGSEPSSPIISTELGDILSKYFLRYSTMLKLAEVKNNSSIRDLIALLCEAEEFEDIRMRQGEKAAYNKARTHQEIRFPPAKIVDRKDKISLLLQIVLAGIPFAEALNTKDIPVNPGSDAVSIFRHSSRILKATMDVALLQRDGGTTKAAFELLRSVNGKAWDASPIVLRQIEGIGEKSIKALASAGISTLEKVVESNPRRIEMLLSRNTPFGNKVIASAQSLPSFTLSVAQVAVKKLADSVEVDCSITVGLQSVENVKFRKRETNVPYFVCVLTIGSDNTFFDYRRLPVRRLLPSGEDSGDKTFTIPCHLTRPSQKIHCIVGCDEIAGSAIVAQLRPEVEPRLYPQPQIQSQVPVQSSEEDRLLEGLDDAIFDDDMLTPPPTTRKAVSKKKSASNTQVAPSKAPSSAAAPSKSAASPSRPAASPSPPPEDEPIKLPNGNYACHHSCKDKNACRHLCCREGMPKPPKPLSKAAKLKRAKSDQEATSLLEKLDKITGGMDDSSKTSKQSEANKKKKSPQHKKKDKAQESGDESAQLEDGSHTSNKRKGSNLKLPSPTKKLKPTNRTLITDVEVEDSDDEIFDDEGVFDSDDELLSKATNPIKTLKKLTFTKPTSSRQPQPKAQSQSQSQPELSEEEDELDSDSDAANPILLGSRSKSSKQVESNSGSRVNSSREDQASPPASSTLSNSNLGTTSTPKSLPNKPKERKRESNFLSRIGQPRFNPSSPSTSSPRSTSKPEQTPSSKSSNPKSRAESPLFLKTPSERSSSFKDNTGSSGTTMDVDEKEPDGEKEKEKITEIEKKEEKEKKTERKGGEDEDEMILDAWAQENIEVEDD